MTRSMVISDHSWLSFLASCYKYSFDSLTVQALSAIFRVKFQWYFAHKLRWAQQLLVITFDFLFLGPIKLLECIYKSVSLSSMKSDKTFRLFKDDQKKISVFFLSCKTVQKTLPQILTIHCLCDLFSCWNFLMKFCFW